MITIARFLMGVGGAVLLALVVGLAIAGCTEAGLGCLGVLGACFVSGAVLAC
jgi:hypothetical protein